MDPRATKDGAGLEKEPASAVSDGLTTGVSAAEAVRAATKALEEGQERARESAVAATMACVRQVGHRHLSYENPHRP